MRWASIVTFLLLVVNSGCDRLFQRSSATMESPSMAPTIIEGEAVHYRLVSPQEARIIQRGDIVVFETPLSNNGGLTIKRVVGLGGETIEIRGDRIFINDEVVQEDWARHPAERVPSAASEYRTSSSAAVSLEPIEIPSNRVFVMGDNWENSFDSRFYGSIAVEVILGIVDLQQHR